MTKPNNSVRPAPKQVSRRHFMASTAAVGAGIALADSLLIATARAETPSQGGTLRQGLGGASDDSFDPVSWSNDVDRNLGFQCMNPLVEINSSSRPRPSSLQLGRCRGPSRDVQYPQGCT
jgi:peptide/nickel transport system substrate-binding protein